MIVIYAVLLSARKPDTVPHQLLDDRSSVWFHYRQSSYSFLASGVNSDRFQSVVNNRIKPYPEFYGRHADNPVGPVVLQGDYSL